MKEKNRPMIINKKTIVEDLGEIKNPIEINDSLIPFPKRSNEDIIDNGLWFEKNGTLYYFKVPKYDSYFLNELVGEKISSYFEVPTVHYQLAKLEIDNQILYGLISPYSRKQDKHYLTLYQWAVQEGWIPRIYSDNFIEFLNQKFPNEPITHQIKRLLAREFYSQELDRNDDELIVEISDNISLAPLVDYEYELDGSEPIQSISLPGIQRINPGLRYERSVILLDQELKDSFLSIKNINMNKILKTIKEETKINLIPYDKDSYLSFDNKMKKYIKTYL
ncbi:MAG: hypothetical protein E7168_00020 [Firmicutes bacterium]|nr:hypothetical protein [Bacillota bacterium]